MRKTALVLLLSAAVMGLEGCQTPPPARQATAVNQVVKKKPTARQATAVNQVAKKPPIRPAATQTITPIVPEAGGGGPSGGGWSG